MYIKSHNTQYALVCFVFILSLFMASKSFANPLWKKNKVSELSILQSSVLSDATKDKFIIGIHVKMRKGWKTYWRVPGDAGIPPYFNWQGSQNIKSTRVLWPVPKYLKDEYGTSIGYADEVVFPVVIEKSLSSVPVELKLQLSYGVCREICIAEEKSVQAKLSKRQFSNLKHHRLLAKYYERVPEKIDLQYARQDLPHIKEIKTELSSAEPRILMHVSYPNGSSSNSVFLEGSDGLYISAPKRVANKKNGQSELVTYQISFSKTEKPESVKGKTITSTLASDQGNSQISWVVK